MSGRHAAAEDVDDEARAESEPDRPGAHRAGDPSVAPPQAAPKSARPKAPSRAKRRAPRSAGS
jgi:hypothetical protein